ncbi:hypothetical protein HanXRQr2_Chr07g0293461 [Helianthus annuus]|uniref:Uncharacterized protein n=1 Tax=Helianthus annuus TaxID=4232 RepID=A0A251TSL7_HELAN|nr:hypothetical protein HanXRQr2_Chr07g0293461 [Helianthus annuus]KAJ0731153.1 hypothetical protein HanOQP8_Chr07g0248691 [Helianthus annuus]KAJ0904601.1 hypothetical protein HanPSC8_Chr07g0284121 [Helianthus annuus]
MMLPFNDSIEKTLKSSIALHRIYYSDSSLLIVDLLNQINLKVYLFLIHSFHLFSEYSEDLCSHVLCLPLQVHYHHWRYWFVTGNLKLDTVSILDITSFFTRSIYHRLHIHKP